jgi:hypothetical protein
MLCNLVGICRFAISSLLLKFSGFSIFGLEYLHSLWICYCGAQKFADLQFVDFEKKGVREKGEVIPVRLPCAALPKMDLTSIEVYEEKKKPGTAKKSK